MSVQGQFTFIKYDTPNALIESIAANNGARVSGSGTNTITIDWSSNLVVQLITLLILITMLLQIITVPLIMLG